MLDTNMETKVNLALLDPPKWGWSAGGKVVNVMTPQEALKRRQRKAARGATPRASGVRKGPKITPTSTNVLANLPSPAPIEKTPAIPKTPAAPIISTIPVAPTPASTVAVTSLPTTLKPPPPPKPAALVIEALPQTIPPFPPLTDKVPPKNSVAPPLTTLAPSTSTTPLVPAPVVLAHTRLTQPPSALVPPPAPVPTPAPMGPPPAKSASAVVTSFSSPASKPATRPAATLHEFNSVVPYTSDNGSKSSNDGSNMYKVQAMTISKDNESEEVLDMYTYHLGRESMELGDEHEPNDTGTQGWHTGAKSKCLVTVQFSLFDHDDDDDDDEEEEEEIWKEQIEWNLDDPNTMTPVAFATKMASEFGLSFGATMDLAQSIQHQLDVHRASDAIYPETPVTLTEYVTDNPRAMPIKSRPCYLYGDANLSRKGGFPMKQKARPKPTPVAATAVATPAKATANKSVSRASFGSKDDNFQFRTPAIYRDAVIQRARKECKFANPALQLKYNHTCHICGVMKRQAAMFPCHIGSHVYCQDHCKSECGLDNILAKPHAMIDYCPICTVSCSCLKCKKRLDNVAVELEKRCQPPAKKDSTKEQTLLKPDEIKFDNILLYCAGRFPAKKIGSGGGGKSFTSNLKKVPKVPALDFPREMCGSRDLEPGSEKEYRTIFTNNGAYLVDPSIIDAELPTTEMAEAAPIPAVIPEDGNVDYCHVCRKAGNLLCCDHCPRAFHEGCVTAEQMNTNKNGGGRWECHVCVAETNGLPQDVVTGHAVFRETDKKCLDKVCEGFVEVKEPNDAFLQSMKTLAMILEMAEHLMEYDFGYMFAEPVDIDAIPEYAAVVKQPMDLGTIAERLIDGHYAKLFDAQQKNWDEIIARVLMDIELVWHNCFTFNFDGSSICRMAEVHARRSRNTRARSLDSRISESVKKQVADFIKACKVERAPMANLPAVRSQPKSKHKISAAWAPGGKCRTVVVLDPQTNRITKLYTTLRTACAAAMYLVSLGHATEWTPLSDYTIKTCIRMGKDDPKLTIFGYRWFFYDELRLNLVVFPDKVINPNLGDWTLQQADGLIQMTDGQNTFLFLSIAEAISSWELPRGTPIGELTTRLEQSRFNEWIPLVGFRWRKLPKDAKPDFLAGATKDHAAIIKVDSLSGRRLVGFDSMAAAYQDWCRACDASPMTQNMELTMDIFQKQFLRSKKKVDGLVWKIMAKKDKPVAKPVVKPPAKPAAKPTPKPAPKPASKPPAKPVIKNPVRHKEAVAAVATQLGKRTIEQVRSLVTAETPPAKVQAIEMVVEQLDVGTPMTSIVVPKGQCKACLIGPAYKKGHIVTCPKSKSYKGPKESVQDDE